MPAVKKPHFKDVPSLVKSDELERGILAYWEQEKIFQKSLEKNKEGKLFTFYDGPPYATGKPHYGHILQSAIKDTVLRYKTMQGYYAPRRVGWDCHGLPVETLVEKELGFKSKKDIEAYGIEKFNQACRDVVFRYIDDFTNTLKRVGRWAEYDNAYATLNREYMESEWWVFKQLWDQGLIYKAFRSTPYCIRCATPLSNFEVSSNYQDKHDQAVYVKLKVVGDASPVLSLLVWTTTPWTLPANVAVAINPELKYVTVEHEGEAYIVAQDRVTTLFGENAQVTHTWSAEELLKLTYEPLYQFLPAENAYRVVAGEHVTATDGTGLVHMAPAFGEEDAEVGKKNNLPVLRTVDTNGLFIPEVTPWAGQNVFAANKDIIKDLQAKGALFKQEHYKHSYPFCWRCDQPLIYYALDTWFVKVSELKTEMLAANEQINWTPKHVQHGRFGKGIESAPDWAVSRNRFWSVPLPIWECDKCEHREVVGSVEELQAKAPKADVVDLHRPYIDKVMWPCEKCQGTMQRVPEVLDVWFDSGSMPYAQWHYPFENKELVEQGYPADFIAESIEMTRAWFYVLHVLAAALTKKDMGLGQNKPAFKNAIASGLIFAEDGRKLSKKLKNYPEIDPTLEKFGADVLRFYLLTSSSFGEPYRFSEKELQHLQRNTYLTLWNVYSFFVRYANVQGWQPKKKQTSSHMLDVWVLARLREVETKVLALSDAYQLDQAAREFITFIDDLSNWYVRRSRVRFQPASAEFNATDAQAALDTLFDVLVRTSKLLAPFMPFVSEEIYRNLTGQDSVHLEAFAAPQKAADKAALQLVADMQRARDIVSEGLALRAAAKIKIRQPLQALTIAGEPLEPELSDIIADEVNVKEVHWDKLPEGQALELDQHITPTLKAEGIAREIIRHGQLLRRQAGYDLADAIELIVTIENPQLQQLVTQQQEMITKALQVKTWQATGEADASEEFKIDEHIIKLGVRRVQ